MAGSVEALLKLLDLEKLEQNLFRGISPKEGWQRVFGGQVIGQALVAASRTVDSSRPAHSLHGYFMRPGDPKVPIIYDVDRIRDGRSFTTRRVVAIQHGKAIFSMGASFHLKEDGFEHQTAMPDVPSPDALPSEADLKKEFIDVVPNHIKSYWERERPIEMRPTDLSHYISNKKLEPCQSIWIRACGRLEDNTALHQCVLAYASDFTLLDTSLMAHGLNVWDPELMMASLDHAIWFHKDFRADEWLLYHQDSPLSSGSRGFNRGSIFTRDGVLVASVAQEGLIRKRTR